MQITQALLALILFIEVLGGKVSLRERHLILKTCIASLLPQEAFICEAQNDNTYPAYLTSAIITWATQQRLRMWAQESYWMPQIHINREK